MIAQHALEEAVGHLGAAIMQSLPTDDQIIMDHVKAAHAILTVVARAQRAMASSVPSRD